MNNKNPENKKVTNVETAKEETNKEFVDGLDGFEAVPDAELKKVMGGQDYIVNNDNLFK